METVGNRHLPRVWLWYPLCQTWPPCLVGACMGRAHDGGLVCLHAAVTVGPPPAPPQWWSRHHGLHFMAVGPRQ